MDANNSKSLLWMGAGDLAARAVPLLKALGLRASYVSRSSKTLATGVRAQPCDVSHDSEVMDLARTKPDYCVITMTPGGRSEADYRSSYLACVEHWINALKTTEHQPSLTVFVSSSSVYAQNAAEQVNERSITKPTRPNGRVLAECEKLLQEADVRSTVLRFSGIYGPNRYHLLKQVCARNFGDATWTNRIHAQDCARVIAFLIEQDMLGHAPPPVLLASDRCPIRSDKLRYWLASELGVEADLSARVELDMERLIEQGKRCDSRLLASMGFEFLYPTYREGFPEIMDAFKNRT